MKRIFYCINLGIVLLCCMAHSAFAESHKFSMTITTTSPAPLHYEFQLMIPPETRTADGGYWGWSFNGNQQGDVSVAYPVGSNRNPLYFLVTKYVFRNMGVGAVLTIKNGQTPVCNYIISAATYPGLTSDFKVALHSSAPGYNCGFTVRNNSGSMSFGSSASFNIVSPR